MSDIVWTINTKNDSFEEIILRLRSLSYNLFRAKNIEHSFHADENLNSMKLSMEQRRNFYLIFKEALNNLVKYSDASRVAISLTHENLSSY
jgi:signal transduction histidine kinase